MEREIKENIAEAYFDVMNAEDILDNIEDLEPKLRKIDWYRKARQYLDKSRQILGRIAEVEPEESVWEETPWFWTEKECKEMGGKWKENTCLFIK